MLAQSPDKSGSKLWAITSYFNPMGYRRRRHNYLRFRRALTVPLVTVELSYQGRFEIEDHEANILVRLRGRDVLWQKERLLNVALEHLPDHCEKVAWLDADVLLQREDWSEETERLLDQFPMVQLFDQLIHLGPDGRLAEAAQAPASRRRASLAYRWMTRTVPPDLFLRPEATSRERCTCGMAWAAGRTFLENHGLYDAMILGMGDKMIAAAALGFFEEAMQAHCLNSRHSDHYRQWAIPVHEQVRGQLGYVAGTALHLWHGDLTDRRYAERYENFEAFDFDPGRDLAVDATGCWRWNSDKNDLHRHVEQYFQQRREDGRTECGGKFPTCRLSPRGQGLGP